MCCPSPQTFLNTFHIRLFVTVLASNLITGEITRSVPPPKRSTALAQTLQYCGFIQHGIISGCRTYLFLFFRPLLEGLFQGLYGSDDQSLGLRRIEIILVNHVLIGRVVGDPHGKTLASHPPGLHYTVRSEVDSHCKSSMV